VRVEAPSSTTRVVASERGPQLHRNGPPRRRRPCLAARSTRSPPGGARSRAAALRRALRPRADRATLGGSGGEGSRADVADVLKPHPVSACSAPVQWALTVARHISLAAIARRGSGRWRGCQGGRADRRARARGGRALLPRRRSPGARTTRANSVRRRSPRGGRQRRGGEGCRLWRRSGRVGVDNMEPSDPRGSLASGLRRPDASYARSAPVSRGAVTGEPNLRSRRSPREVPPVTRTLRSRRTRSVLVNGRAATVSPPQRTSLPAGSPDLVAPAAPLRSGWRQAAHRLANREHPP